MAGDIRCSHCGRQLSSAGREIGLMIWNPKKGKWGRWVPTCASERCSGIPNDIKVGELQNYLLNKYGGRFPDGK